MNRTLAVAAGVAAAVALTPPLAQADPNPVSPHASPFVLSPLKTSTLRPSQTVATGLLTPLSVTMASNGSVYFTQNFAGLLNIVGPDRKVRTVFSSGGSEVGAVSSHGNRITFATTAAGPGTSSMLHRLINGKASNFGNLTAYEAKYNPDGKQSYGVPNLAPSCAKQVPKEFGPISYKGMNDNAHPYATYFDGKNTYVADAGANDILKVSDSGKVSTVAVLPPIPQKITAEDIKQNPGLPSCLIGKTFYAEGVPTGITMYKGKLLVSQLPGGMGRGGSVWQINPTTGTKKKLASDLAGITSISVSPNGQVYLASMFAGVVLRLPACGGKPVVLQSVSQPGAVSWSPKGLLVTADVLAGAGDPDSGEPPSGPPAAKVLLYSLYPGKKCPTAVAGGKSPMCRM